MGVYIDITGQKFGNWTVLYRVSRPNKAARFRCRCDCGHEADVNSIDLRSGHSQSCGCKPRKHGHSPASGPSATYQTWMAMRSRCEYPKHIAYRWYGGRGIKVCQRWEKFENFLADMGEKPKGKEIDRYPDKNGNYEPDNCRWATRKEQLNNTRRNRWYSFSGHRYTLTQWANYLGIGVTTLMKRLDKWPIKRALSGPKLSNEKLITFQDQTMNVGQWAAHLGIKRKSLWARLQRMPVEKALSFHRK